MHMHLGVPKCKQPAQATFRLRADFTRNIRTSTTDKNIRVLSAQESRTRQNSVAFVTGTACGLIVSITLGGHVIPAGQSV